MSCSLSQSCFVKWSLKVNEKNVSRVQPQRTWTSWKSNWHKTISWTWTFKLILFYPTNLEIKFNSDCILSSWLKLRSHTQLLFHLTTNPFISSILNPIRKQKFKSLVQNVQTPCQALSSHAFTKNTRLQEKKNCNWTHKQSHFPCFAKHTDIPASLRPWTQQTPVCLSTKMPIELNLKWPFWFWKQEIKTFFDSH